MKAAWLIAALAIAGCTENQQAPGQETFALYCTSCHGRTAEGNGPLARDLPVRPANLTALARENGGHFPYSRVMAKINGYPGQFHVMPEFGPLMQGPMIPWTDETGQTIATPKPLLDLARYLASIQKP